ncbi:MULTISPECIES: helix-turn-helix domain-containing protein [unclassified Undibacterium]|uniref:helix-turn-helix domain-containing protein n=1 Tax=unclassified Undibacterium TaxID=2630295 RepID=UPI002AC94403|nr:MULTISPECIES: helix-turn-helix domain-containing protein [unclassified Undibacterium]MEB0137978.1 helix-turn-helix domain-containing protein [Undibacterium sp. CCC2.1]MEB0170689.1 helix-turn-helix domain-containing protein [Undibacterium sp. CCC1.1]MEB0177030.1 helix-turn-helix domain-containing protein [Undibacterium sp. CCC3.4]MEB0216319.1 helix-turn-helix domain-containing protein [Undibacterium sp. 5I2]WPX42503.1 helix-turn-helix domain-containing protein [Undibacterium sp. CCC3.4]
MSNFNQRLRAERKRLGFNQEKFAALGGVTKDTQLNYESGERRPDSVYLEKLAKAGVDILYLLTGVSHEESLNEDENELLQNFRSLDVRGQAGVLGMLHGLLTVSEDWKRTVIKGEVGQVVQGDQDVHGPLNFTVGKGTPSKKQ